MPAPIEDIPVCADFNAGNTKMEGALRYPVRLRVLEGKTVLFRTILAGQRHAEDPKPRTLIIDDNAKYTVEWAQCNNPHAPRSVTGVHSTKSRDRARDGEATAYDCGEATLYKPDGVLQTRKGDPASHVIHFEAPPNAECWTGDAPPPTTGALLDAGAALEGGAPAAAAADVGQEVAAVAGADAGSVASDGGGALAKDAGAK